VRPDINKERKRIFFFVPDLNGGGAERALVNLLKNWPGHGTGALEPTLVVRRWQGEYTGEIPERVHRIVLGTDRSGARTTVATVLKLGLEIRRQRPVAVVSFLSGPAVFLAARLFNPHCKVILSLQTSPANWLANESNLGRSLVRMAQGQVFRRADLLLPISKGIAMELMEAYRLPDNAMTIINNSVDLSMIERESSGSCPPELAACKGAIRIISAGRLVRQKSQEILIEAVAQLVGLGRKAELFILGQGPDQAFLEEYASRLGILQHISFLGFQQNPWLFFRHADIFALSSRFEGFANVIIEAMACGLPVVSTDAPHGPGEIIRDGVDGLLVPVGDSRSLAQALLRLIDDPAMRQDFAAKSLIRARDYDIGKISERFRNTLENFLVRE
jgi:glycosyltransferase involved in cell wall biosynthesis